MPDGQSSASVVVVDPVKAAQERNEAARKLLNDSFEKNLQLNIFKGTQYTVPYTFKVLGTDEQAAEARKALQTAFDICDQHLNVYNKTSEVSKFNSLPAGQPHTMSSHMATCVNALLRVFNGSRGTFDPGVAGVAKGFRQKMISGHPMNQETIKEVEEALRKYGTLRAVKVNSREGTMTKTEDLTTLDLGGLNKGYTIDLAMDMLKQKQYLGAFLEWGGDCKAIGHNHKKEPWRVGIIQPPSLEQIEKGDTANLREPETATYLRVVNLEDGEAVATSGDYENLWSCFSSGSQQKYNSLFDPKTLKFLRPTDNNVAQVTVKSSSCLIADALASASLLKYQFSEVRGFLEPWRFVKDAVTDFTAYIRRDALMAKMQKLAHENSEMKTARHLAALPARVVVVGGGLAGLCATIEASRAGASVVLIEKCARLGGNSAKATSGINGWGTSSQCAKNVADDGRLFERDTFLSGKGGNTGIGLVQTLSVKSRSAIHWLMREFNLPLTVISQLGGHSRPRTHRAPDKADGTPVPIGYTIMQHLIQHVTGDLRGRVTVMTNTSVHSLLTKKEVDTEGRSKVHGVVYSQDSPDGKTTGEKIELSADAVVLTTGGFGNDRTETSLLKKYTPELEKTPTTNGAFATGDGMKMASAIGASLVDMDKVQLHPTGLVDPNDPGNATKYLGPEALRGSGGILLNQHGKRFINELDLRAVVSRGIIQQGFEYPGSNGCKVAYCVLNETAVKLFGPNSLAFYRDKLKLFRKFETVEELAAAISAPVDVVIESLKQYEVTSTAKTPCPLTGKNVFPCTIGPQGPFTVALVTPSIHYTMGGVSITPSAEVLDERVIPGIGQAQRRTILGLFAAGEVTGGVHGNNRLGGNSLLECVVFGRIAGDRAASVLQKKPTALSRDEWCPVVLRETIEGREFGAGSRVLKFNLPGSTQRSGLSLGQFVGIKGEWDGKQLLGYYSPITLPNDPGVIGILARVDKGNLRDWIGSMKAGDAVYMKACGGLTIDRNPQEKSFSLNGTPITSIGMIAGGTGVAPMLQLIRAALKAPYNETIKKLSLIYAAENEAELTYRNILEDFQHDASPAGKFKCHFVLNNPPPGWMEGVGFVDKRALGQGLPPPDPNLLICICGPPVMQRIVVTQLQQMGYHMPLVRTVDEDSSPGNSKM